MVTALETFAGAGGACTGLKRAAVDVVASLERDKDALCSLQANGHNAVEADLFSHDFTQYRGVDIVSGGPPCQPFSAAGSHKGEFDERDGIPHFIRAVREAQPRIFVMENVRGLTYKKHRAYLDRVVAEFVALHYAVSWGVLNAANYGVPQTRQRLFVVGHADYGRYGTPRTPEPTHTKAQWVSMEDALGWAGSVTSNNSVAGVGRAERGTDRPAFAVTSRTDLWKLHLRRGSGAEERHGLRPDTPITRPAPTVRERFRDGTWVLHTNRGQNAEGERQVVTPDRPAPTFSVESGAQWRWVHESTPARTMKVDGVPVEPHEAAALQAFPPTYAFCGSRSSVFRQIGNACPPQLIAAVVGAQLGIWPKCCTEELAA
jgi:DNA (cytosine-5)-methyltransferase 1